MYVLVKTKPGRKTSLTKHIKKIKDVKDVEIILGKNELLAKLNPFFDKNKNQLKQIKTKFNKLKTKGVVDFQLFQIQEDRNSFVDNNRFIKHYFFDIDGTLTKKNSPGFVHYAVNEIFTEMKKLEVSVHFATGRSMRIVKNLIKKYPVQPEAIAENGGIIIGFGEDNYELLGHREQPVEFVNYLRTQNYNVHRDTNQMGHLTEMILVKDSVSRKKIEKAKENAKKELGIDVNILASQNSYHITEKGIDKGSALNELCNKLQLGSYDEIISVGDSELDVPMFEASHKSYLLGNATPEAKKLAPKTTKKLRGKYIDAIRKIYSDLAKF